MEEEKPTYYAIIPADVRYDKDLTDREKLLFAEITTLCNKTGECWASNEYFSKLYNISIRSIQRSISNLINKGYLDKILIYKKDCKEVEKRIITLRKNLSPPPCQICHDPGVKNVTDNNTSINNTSNNIYAQNEKIGNSLEHLEESFNEFWSLYPRKIAKAKAKLSFSSALKKTNSKVILEGVKNYLKEIETKKTEEKYIKHPSTWLNQGCWDDEYVSSLNSSAKPSSVKYEAEQSGIKYEVIDTASDVLTKQNITSDEFIEKLNKWKDEYRERTGKFILDTEIPKEVVIEILKSNKQ